LENIILNAKIIENNHADGTVQIGNRVTIAEEGFPPETYKIVGPTEASPADGLISNKSPVGSALLGKRVGDIAQIKTPSGLIEMVITAID
jgi:transcription elongation factor GreA